MAATVFVYLSKSTVARNSRSELWSCCLVLWGYFYQLFFPDIIGVASCNLFCGSHYVALLYSWLLGLYLFSEHRVFPTHIDLLLKFALISISCVCRD